MATPEITAADEALARHQRRLHRALRLPRRRELPLQGAQGADPRARREDLRVQERAAVDARLPPQGARPLPRSAHADLGLADPRAGRLRRHPLLRARVRARRALVGRRPRGRQEDVRPPRHPRGRAQVPGRRRRAVRVGGRLPPGPQDLEEQGVIFMDMDSGLREHEELVREYFATIIPSNDNKLAALNSAVWSGGSFVYVPPGVHVEMPLQAYFRINTENMGQFERTLIIADEGSYVHYVEGCTAPTYSIGLAALRGRRAHRQARRAHPLHDRPELVAERLQPRHQARGRRDRRHGRVGRLQPRLEADDEVPVGLPHGRARPRRDPLDRLRRRGPAPGRRRQDHPRRAEHDLEHLRQVDLQGRRALARTAACSRSPRARTARSRRSSATRCCSTRAAARTPTRRSASARTTSTSATRPRSRRSARSSSSTSCPTGCPRRRPPS